MGVTNKLMPRWMEIKTGKSKPVDLFKSVEYNNPVKQKGKIRHKNWWKIDP